MSAVLSLVYILQMLCFDHLICKSSAEVRITLKKVSPRNSCAKVASLMPDSLTGNFFLVIRSFWYSKTPFSDQVVGVGSTFLSSSHRLRLLLFLYSEMYTAHFRKLGLGRTRPETCTFDAMLRCYVRLNVMSSVFMEFFGLQCPNH